MVRLSISGAWSVLKSIFSEKLPALFGLQPLPQTPKGPLVSVPERALLEMLSEVGGRQGIEEAETSWKVFDLCGRRSWGNC